MNRIVGPALCLALSTLVPASAQVPLGEPDEGVRVAVVPGTDPDAAIEMRATMTLKGDPAWGRIRVDRVDEGVVWLEGSVTDEGRLADALDALENLEGVREIRSEVEVDSTIGDDLP